MRGSPVRKGAEVFCQAGVHAPDRLEDRYGKGLQERRFAASVLPEESPYAIEREKLITAGADEEQDKDY